MPRASHAQACYAAWSVNCAPDLCKSDKTLVIPFETLDVSQEQIATTEAPVSMFVGLSDQPICRFFILSVALTLEAIAGLVDAKRIAAAQIQPPRSVTAFLAISHLRDGLTTFLESLRNGLDLEFFIKVQLFQAPVLLFGRFDARHHGDIHAAVLGAPFVKRRRAGAQLTANILDSKTNFYKINSV